MLLANESQTWGLNKHQWSGIAFLFLLVTLGSVIWKQHLELVGLKRTPPAVEAAVHELAAIGKACIHAAQAGTFKDKPGELFHNFEPQLDRLLSPERMDQFARFLKSRGILKFSTMGPGGPQVQYVGSVYSEADLLMQIAGWIVQHKPRCIQDLNPSFLLTSPTEK